MPAKIVKICGIRKVDDAIAAIDAGADMLGVIMVPGRKRTVDHAEAKLIAKAALTSRFDKSRRFVSAKELNEYIASQSFASFEDYLLAYRDLILKNGPFLTGVFRNQNPKTVFELAEELNLDFIQLHGSEDPAEYMALNSERKFGIVKRFVIPTQTASMTDFLKTLSDSKDMGFALPLLDSELGGEGKPIDWSLINDLQGSFILAGGLTPDNLISTKKYSDKIVGYDVSGGVEDENGEKVHDKIRQFVTEGKKIGIQSQ
ncbi:hypothetical protein FDK38_003456 [Candidozyma auris]|nr:hypothetical protein FDK38_003456 [[Candida] auris]